MNYFLHIGYPKCFSTSLQRNYFSKHKEIFYGGIGNGNSNIEFYNDHLNVLFESGILYQNEFNFNRNFEFHRDTLNNFKKEFLDSDKKVACFSFEHIIFNFSSQSVDTREKLRRVKLLFGDNSKIIIFIREQFGFLVSLYKEFVNNGYYGSFNDFFKYIYKYQDRNFFTDLLYSNVLNYLVELFGRENISVHIFENYRNREGLLNSSKLTDDLNLFMGVSDDGLIIQNSNPSIPDESLVARIKANKEIHYDYGGDFLSGFEDHRRRKYFNTFLKMNLSEEELFRNVLLKRYSKECAATYSKEAFFWEVEKYIYKFFDEQFTADVIRLENILEFNVQSIFKESKLAVVDKFKFI